MHIQSVSPLPSTTAAQPVEWKMTSRKRSYTDEANSLMMMDVIESGQFDMNELETVWDEEFEDDVD